MLRYELVLEHGVGDRSQKVFVAAVAVTFFRGIRKART